MDISQLSDTVINFLKTYPLAGFGLFLAVCCLLLMNRRDGHKLIITLLFVAAAVAAIVYFGPTLDNGMTQKDEMIYKTERALK